MLDEPLIEPQFSSPWTSSVKTWTDRRAVLRLDDSVHPPIELELERCARGRLSESYPVGSRDVEIRLDVPGDLALLTPTLVAVTAAIRTSDPQCKKVVYCVDRNEKPYRTHSRTEVFAAAVDAGFRYVVDIDLVDVEFSLLVHEPDWVTEVDIDLDHVPGT